MSLIEREGEIRALARALQLSQGFALFFCVYNSAGLRHELLIELFTLDPSLGKLVWLQERTDSLEDGAWMKEGTEPLHLYGFEGWLQDGADSSDPFLSSLNQGRNDLIQRCRRPLVFWVRQSTLQAFAVGAPDFFSIRSGTFFFRRDRNEVSQIRWIWGYAPAESVMNPQQRRQRLEFLSQLVAEPAGEREQVFQLLSAARLLELGGQPEAALEFLAKARGQLSSPIWSCTLDFHSVSIRVRNTRLSSFEALMWLFTLYSNRLVSLDPATEARPAWDDASAVSFLYSRLVDAYLQLFWGNEELTMRHCLYLERYADSPLLPDGRFQLAHLRAMSAIQRDDHPAARVALAQARQELAESLGDEHPHQGLLLYTEGWMFFQQGRLRQARQNWEATASFWGRFFDGKSRELCSVWTHLALVCQELNEPEQSLDYRVRAEACDPGWMSWEGDPEQSPWPTQKLKELRGAPSEVDL